MSKPLKNFNVDVALKRKIVDDLTKKFPAGRSGRLRKTDYEVAREYSYHHEAYRNLVSLREHLNVEGVYYGWEAELIWNLQLHDYHDIRCYIRSNEYSPNSVLSSHAVSRRANRLHIRTQDALRILRREGRPGIYRVGYGYGGKGKAYVHADDVESAKIYTNTMLGSVLRKPDATSYDAKAELIEIGSVTNLTKYNDKTAVYLTENATANLAEAERRLEEAKDELAAAQNAAMIIQSLSGMQIAAALEDN